jgi:LacI family transcriptional regulator
MAKQWHVAILIETSRGFGRGLLAGVADYLEQHGPWSIYFQPHGVEAQPPRWLRSWRGDGILARIADRRTADVVRAAKVPVVDLRYGIRGLGLPEVGIDNEPMVAMAFDHLANCGFEHFGFCSLGRGMDIWMDHRCDLFRRLVEAQGWFCHVFDAPRRRAALDWEEEQERIAAWVGGLPKPVGLMACNDDRGQRLLDACRRAGVAVPEEAAVIGVGNDEVLCNLAYPPLSSVDVAARDIGFAAAALLDRLMGGAPPPAKRVSIPPRGVVGRRSTDVLVTDDRELARAIQGLRTQACSGLRLKDFVKTTGLSHRALERGTRKLLGRSPKEEIVRVQLERARRLLADGELSIATVAERCGFAQANYFCQVFRARVGMTPAAYRRQNRLAR